MMKKLNGHEYAQAREYVNNDGFSGKLVSYTTTVIEIDSNGWLYCNGLYSRTTINHIRWFMQERGLTYQLAKELYTTGQRYNIFTGEIQKVEG